MPLADGAQVGPYEIRSLIGFGGMGRCISYPAIVSIYAPGQSDDRHYISMELVSGRTLRQVVRDGPMAPRRALQIAAQIADAAPRERSATR